MKHIQKSLPRIICVVGPTSSGKTALSLRLAEMLNGEVVNADARQCYKQFTIGTGKPEGAWKRLDGYRAYVVRGTSHHLMDVLEPRTTMTVAEWRRKAMTAIRSIVGRFHLPIVVGGTGLYIKALVDNPSFPKVEPHPELRSAFEEKKMEELVHLLGTLDPAALDEVDLKNRRRVIRALEIITFTGKPFTAQKQFGKPLVEAFQIGIQQSRAELYDRIDQEIDSMVKRGWVEEVQALLSKGISPDAPAMTAIGYRDFAAHLQGRKTLESAIQDCKHAVHQYAKRQETWFKKDKRIHWVTTEEEGISAVAAWLGKEHFSSS